MATSGLKPVQESRLEISLASPCGAFIMAGEFQPPLPRSNRQPNLCEEVVKQNVDAFMQVIFFFESIKKVQSPVFSENFFCSKKILSQNKGRLLVEFWLAHNKLLGFWYISVHQEKSLHGCTHVGPSHHRKAQENFWKGRFALAPKMQGLMCTPFSHRQTCPVLLQSLSSHALQKVKNQILFPQHSGISLSTATSIFLFSLTLSQPSNSPSTSPSCQILTLSLTQTGPLLCRASPWVHWLTRTEQQDVVWKDRKVWFYLLFTSIHSLCSPIP